ncbi:MAG: 4,5-DOPA dioxygenase extradiol [Oscillospiraceae bacterium]|jgi:4,5-DOPA dioxygenase extradiol|nr:4,5-DOPA dioxygenase extradiol [Oscillospiraceae bacterium]
MERMPALFVGHGSPMNAIENNEYSARWEALGKKLPRPKAILSVSAHWFTQGTRLTDASAPRMVYDMYGFPEALYRVRYPAPGSPEFAHEAAELLGPRARTDNTWGLDHGSWSVLCRMFPKADIPVFQFSVDAKASPGEHFAIGEKLSALRERGVMIFGSGNVVHNLSRVNWGMNGGYDWAEEFDAYIKSAVASRDFDPVINYEAAGSSAVLAFPTFEHFAPLLYVLGAAYEKDTLSVFNDSCTLGSLSMTGYLFD